MMSIKIDYIAELNSIYAKGNKLIRLQLQLVFVCMYTKYSRDNGSYLCIENGMQRWKIEERTSNQEWVREQKSVQQKRMYAYGDGT